MSALTLRADPKDGFTQIVGVGGIGTGTILGLEGTHTLGRNESRMARAIDARDYCKLHIVEHYVAVLLGCRETRDIFRVFAVGNVGSDAAGATLMREMSDAGIDIRYVKIEPECSTLFSVTLVYPDKSSGNITTSNSAACALSGTQLNQCRRMLEMAGKHGIALCLPEVPIEARQEFLQIATDCGSYRVASFPSGEMEIVHRLNLLSQVDLLALNREETAAMGGVALSEADNLRLDACSAMAMTANPDMRIVSTAGADGAFVFENRAWMHFQSVPVEAVSTAGAGDALLAGTIAGLAAGLPLTDAKVTDADGATVLRSAIDLGLALAALSVTSPHTIHPGVTLEGLLAFAGVSGMVISTDLQRRCSYGVTANCEGKSARTNAAR
jgi:sugar/nucleoside kinase (ribokinase family)